MLADAEASILRFSLFTGCRYGYAGYADCCRFHMLLRLRPFSLPATELLCRAIMMVSSPVITYYAQALRARLQRA